MIWKDQPLPGPGFMDIILNQLKKSNIFLAEKTQSALFASFSGYLRLE
jgi:hypothetical protein